MDRWEVVGPAVSGGIMVGISYEAAYLLWIGLFVIGFLIYATVCKGLRRLMGSNNSDTKK